MQSVLFCCVSFGILSYLHYFKYVKMQCTITDSTVFSITLQVTHMPMSIYYLTSFFLLFLQYFLGWWWGRVLSHPPPENHQDGTLMVKKRVWNDGHFLPLMITICLFMCIVLLSLFFFSYFPQNYMPYAVLFHFHFQLLLL